MLNDKKVLNHPSFTCAEDLKTICAPLEKLGISYFSHARVDNQKQLSGLALAPELFKLYLEKKYYNFDIHTLEPNLPEQYVIWDTVERTKETKEFYDDFQGFGMGHSFTIIQQNEHYTHCFNFSAPLGQDSINSRYLQQIDSLKKFINYFKNKIRENKILRSAYDIKFKIKETNSGYFTNEDHSTSNLKEFNQDIDQTPRFYAANNQYLTPREFELLYWLAQGKTLEEIAMTISITLRTAKAHVKNIKDKFNCNNQFQLGMLFRELQGLR